MGDYDLASDLAAKVADKVLDRALDKALDPILGRIGLGGDDSSAYFAQVMQSLQQIQVTLDDLSQRMSDIGADITAVEQSVTRVSMQVADAELQTALQAYTGDVATIEQNFQTYQNALTSMASSTNIRDAFDDLYQLFQVENVDAVAIAMRDVHDRFLGTGELTGILSFQADVCQAALDTWASNPIHLYVTNGPINPGFWSSEFYDSSLIPHEWLRVYTDAISASVIPTFKAVLSVQLKGLLFLRSAWGHTALESNLATHVSNIIATIAGMQSWWSTVDPDDAVAAVLKTRGARLPDDALNNVWDNTGNVWEHQQSEEVQNPFDTDWLMWRDPDEPAYELSLHALVVYQPWQYGSCAARSVDNFGLEDRPTGVWKRYFYNYGTINPLDIPRPSASKPSAAPDVLAQFLSGLPTDQSQLTTSQTSAT